MGGMMFKVQNVCLNLMLCWLMLLYLLHLLVRCMVFCSMASRFCVAPVWVSFQCTDTVHVQSSLAFMIEWVLAAWSMVLNCWWPTGGILEQSLGKKCTSWERNVIYRCYLDDFFFAVIKSLFGSTVLKFSTTPLEPVCLELLTKLYNLTYFELTLSLK
jgi:hypothetical protein